MKEFVGIDVSKDFVDVYYLEAEQRQRLPIEPSCLVDLAKQIPASALVLLEATGGYERPVVSSLRKAGLDVKVVNPKKVRDFARSRGILAKTDALDARVLALFAQSMPLPVIEPPTEQEETLGRDATI